MAKTVGLQEQIYLTLTMYACFLVVQLAAEMLPELHYEC